MSRWSSSQDVNRRRVGVGRFGLFALGLVAALASGARPVRADEVSVSFAGTIDSILQLSSVQPFPFGPLIFPTPTWGSFSVGGAFTVTLTYDTGTSPAAGSTSGQALFESSLVSMTFELENGGFTSTVTAGNILQANGGVDSFNLVDIDLGLHNGDLANPTPLPDADASAGPLVELRDNQATVISDALVMLNPIPPVSEWEHRQLYLSFGSQTSTVPWVGSTKTFTVPRHQIFGTVTALGSPGDDCVFAASIATGAAEAFDTTMATNDGPNPSCGGATAPVDIWFEYTADCTGIATASTCGSTFDTRVTVYAGGSCPPTTELACNDDSCGLQSLVSWPVTAGTTYLLQVGGYNGAVGTGDLLITCSDPSANDDCTNAAAVTDGVTDFDTTTASTDGLGVDFMACAQWAGTDPILYNDVWFVYTAAANSTVTVSTCDIGVIDTRLAVWDASVSCPPDPGVDTPLACQDDEANCANFTSRVDFTALAGQTYLIQLGGFSPGVAGAGQLEISSVADPAFIRGNCNSDAAVDIGDAIYLLGNLFPGANPPNVLGCLDACDGNDDGLINIADAIAILSALFGSPTTPLPPPSSCDVDPTTAGDPLDCAAGNGPACEQR